MFQSARIDYDRVLASVYGRAVSAILVDFDCTAYNSAHCVSGPTVLRLNYMMRRADTEKLADYLVKLIDEMRAENSALQYGDIVILTEMAAYYTLSRALLDRFAAIKIPCGSVRECYRRDLCVDTYHMPSHEWRCVIVVDSLESRANNNNYQIYFAKSRCQTRLVLIKVSFSDPMFIE